MEVHVLDKINVAPVCENVVSILTKKIEEKIVEIFTGILRYHYRNFAKSLQISTKILKAS